ncbi:hypothetical protein HMPREF1069_02592 [Bacteroides ovatus CL02T12C04]|nr:hypothetical protein HMPREF1069_02592 [Bacteroides ovatus CL02T12C04]
MKLQKLNIRGRIMNIAKWRYKLEIFKVNAARKSKVDDNTARMQSIKQLGV